MTLPTEAVPVLVTGAGGGSLGEQLIKALRAAPTRYRIVATDLTAASWGLIAADHGYVVPRADHQEYLDSVFSICREHGIRAVFPGSEAELAVMSAHRNRFAAEAILLPINPPELLEVCLNKLTTATRLQELGFRVPAWRRVTTVADAASFEHLPAVLKPSSGGGGSSDLFLVQTRGELTASTSQLLRLYEEFIVQEYVGTVDSEFTVGVLSDLDGQLVNSIALQRDILTPLSNRARVPNRSGVTRLGPLLAISSGVSQGRIGRFPQVTDTCERIAAAFGARGPINIQCRFVDGEVVVFEINPRWSGTTSLRAMVGYNEPDVLIRRHLFGEHIEPHFEYGSATIVRGLSEHMVPNAPPPSLDLTLPP